VWRHKQDVTVLERSLVSPFTIIIACYNHYQSEKMSNQHEISITERARSRVKPETRKFISKNIDIAKRIRAVLNEQNSTVENMASLLGKDVDETYLMISGMYNLTLEDITEMETVLGVDIITTPK
jgi:hypothetical protein